MAQVTVTATLNAADATPIANANICFTLLTTGAEPSVFYVSTPIIARTDSLGQLSQSLWVNGDGITSTCYRVVFPDQFAFDFEIPAGTTGTIDLYQLYLNSV